MVGGREGVDTKSSTTAVWFGTQWGRCCALLRNNSDASWRVGELPQPDLAAARHHQEWKPTEGEREDTPLSLLSSKSTETGSKGTDWRGGAAASGRDFTESRKAEMQLGGTWSSSGPKGYVHVRTGAWYSARGSLESVAVC